MYLRKPRLVPTVLAAIVLLPLVLEAQQQAQTTQQENEEPTIKVDVDVVNVLFSVRDRKGALVPGLSKEDFIVSEEGKPQEIKFFARETDLPLTIGLLVDVSRSQENLIETERRAALQFFSNVLKEKDMAFLISFGTDTELLQDFTNSTTLLRKGLEGLRVQASPYVPGILNPGPIPSNPRGTVLFEAIYLAAEEKLRREVGRKAIIVITDGVDVGSRIKMSEAMEAAHKSDAIVYSILFSDPRYGGSDSDLKRISEDTGGRVFKVSKKQTLDDIFKQIEMEMRSQYAIGYTPAKPTGDGGFRRIEIKTRDKDLRVQARKGYYATSGRP